MEVDEETDLSVQRNMLVTCLLNYTHSKLPIKQADLKEALNKDKALFEQCFPLAQKALEKTYGIIVEKVPKTKSSQAVQYICYSEMSVASTKEYNDEQKRHLTLLFLVLSYIFMIGGKVYDSQIENFLNGLKIYYDREHAYFGGNLKKLITDTFVKQLYLEHEKSKSEFDTEVRHLYSWGYRSQVEFNKKAVLSATAKILGTPEEIFIEQWNEANKSNEVEASQDGD